MKAESNTVARIEVAQVNKETDWSNVVERFVVAEDVKQSSRNLYTRTLTQFFKWLNDTNRLDKIASMQLERADILDYKADLLGKHLSPLTVGSYIVAVRKFFAYLEAAKIYPNIAAGVKTPHREKGIYKEHLTDSLSKDLLDYERGKNLRDYAMVNLMIRTGLRTIEVVRADVADIAIEQGRRVLYVWGKGHDSKDNFVVLSDKAWGPLQAYLNSRKGVKGDEPLFVSNSRQNKGERLTTRTVSGVCKSGLRGIGIDSHKYTAHSLRHTTACAILKHGGQLADAQGVLRHSSPVTTQVYLESIKKELRLERAPELLLDSFI